MVTAGLEGFLLTVLALIIIVIFGGSAYAFFYAIFLFIFSSGDPEKIKQAWNSIRFMILGVILTLALLFIFPVVLERIGVPNSDAFSARNIFSHTGEIFKFLLSFGSDSIKNYNGNIDGSGGTGGSGGGTGGFEL